MFQMKTALPKARKILVSLPLVLALSTTSALAAYELPSGRDPKLNKEDLTQLHAISKGISTIAKHGQKGIVFVSVSKIVRGQPFGNVNPFDFFFGPQGSPFGPGGRGPQGGGRAPEYKQEGLGSGFIIDLEKGYVLTNNHVIDEADEINLKLANGETHDAKVIGRDKNTDIAVVQIKGKFDKQGLEQLSLGDSTEAEVGDIAIALGAPFGLEASVSMGVVSAISRGSLSITNLGNFIQTDAAINPGNSGGPLLDTSGLVIGINTAIFSKSGAYNGIGFAIPSNLVRNIANQLINSGKVAQGYLGVLLGAMEPDLAKQFGIPKEYRGALIRSVEPKSPAARAGLDAGDVVVKVNDKKINDVEQLRSEIGLAKPGQSVELSYFRDGKMKTTMVKLGDFSEASTTAGGGETDKKTEGFGLSVTTFNAGSSTKYKSSKGVLVTDVTPDMPADHAGLQKGDLIVQVNNANVGTVEGFLKAIKDQRRSLLKIERERVYMIVALER